MSFNQGYAEAPGFPPGLTMHSFVRTQKPTRHDKPASSVGRHGPFVGLPHAMGNQAVLRMLQAQEARSAPAAQNQPASAVPENRREQEADQIGAHVARHSSPTSWESPAESGRLPSQARVQVENLLGESFADVRVHADASAGDKVRAEGAVAMARGGDLFIAPWAYRPDHPLGQGLIAHELAHVAQQRLGRNAARDAFLSGTGHEQGIQDLIAERRAGETAAHWRQVSPKEGGLTPAPPGMTQRCIAGCSSCQEDRGPSPEEVRKAELKAQAATLKGTIDNPGKASFGELAAANAKYMDVAHDLAVLERGFGTHVGNRARDVGGSRTPAPTKTDCTEYTVAVLRETFAAKGQEAAFKKVLAGATKASGGALKGTELIDQLRQQSGWKVLYWNPDTKFVDTKTDGSKDTEHTYSAHVAKTKGTYYDIPIEKDKMIVNYSPKKGTGTAQDKTMLEKLRKIPFGVIAARGGRHIAMLVSGVVYEVHWQEECTSERVFEATPLESWVWLSGLVAAPASDVDNAWK